MFGGLDGYTYYKKITLSRASGAVTNYQMKLLVGESSGATGEDVDCGGHVLASFNDLRFCDGNGTLLDYWIQSITGTTPNQLATVWIEFNTIGTSATPFYMCYGKAGASAVSCYADTFPAGLGGDFEGNNLDRWENSGAATSAGSKKEGAYGCDLTGDYARIRCPVGLGYAGTYLVAVEFWIYPKQTDKYIHCYWNYDATHSARFYFVDSAKMQYYNGASLTDMPATNTYAANTWYRVKILMTAASFAVYVYNADGSTRSSMTGAAYNATMGGGFTFGFADLSPGADFYGDSVIYRQYAPTEPAWGSWGAEITRVTATVAIAPAISVAVDGARLASGETEISPVAEVAADGARIAAGRSIVGVIAGVAASGASTRAGVVAVTIAAGLAAVGGAIRPATAAISPAVTITASGGKKNLGTVAIVAVASLTAEAHTVVPASVAVQAAAALTADAYSIRSGAATIEPTPAITAEGNRIAAGAVVMTPAVAMSAKGGRYNEGTVAINAAVAVAAVAEAKRLATATIQPAVSMVAEGNRRASGAAVLAPALSVAVDGDRIASGAAVIAPAVSVSADAHVIASALAAILITAGLEAIATRRIDGGTVTITITAGVTAAAIRAAMIAIGLSGNLADGETIVIDTDAMTFEIDGVNRLKDMVGDFPIMPPGDSALIYEDDSGARTIDLSVKHTPRDV